VPFAPTAEPAAALTPKLQPSPTRYAFSPPATETPRPRRALGEGGRPTPTPLLISRSGADGAGQAPAAKAGDNPGGAEAGQQLAQERSVTPAWLLRYAGYAAIMAVLLTMGWHVLRRRRRVASGAAQQSDGGDERVS
jgi:hypothetical protein